MAGVSAAIVILAVAAVLIQVRKGSLRQKQLSSLSEEYRAVLIDLYAMIEVSTVSGRAKQDTRDMLLEIFSMAAEQGRPVKDVVGEDMSAYLDQFLAEQGKTWNPVYVISYTMVLFVIYLFAIKVLIVLKLGGFTSETLSAAPLDVGIVGMYAVVAFVFFPLLLWMKQKAARERWEGNRQMLVALPLLLPLGLAVLLMNSHKYIQMQLWLDRPVPLLDSWFKVVLGLVVLGFSVALMRHSQK
jgi:DNA-binding ferritin-like protein (Dps family)